MNAIAAKKRRGRPPKLSREIILSVAQEIPFEQLSMLKLAAKLRVSDAALYYYFSTSDALRRAIIDQLTVQFPLPRATKDWRRWIRAYAQTIFKFTEHIPGGAAYLMSHGPIGQEQFKIIEKALGILVKAGFSVEKAWMIYTGVVNLAIEYAQKRDQRAQTELFSKQSAVGQFAETINDLQDPQFPLLRTAALIQMQISLDQQFDFVLDHFLEAISAP